MDDFVDCDLGETLPENESIDIFDDEPPAKKKRGANLKYIFIEEAESYDDLKEKATNAGLKLTEDFVENLINKIAKKTKIFIFKSAGNEGPFHFTVTPANLQIEESIFIIGAVLTNDIKKRIYAIDDNSSSPSLCSFSSRGPSYNGNRGLDFVAPGVAVLDTPRFINSRRKEVIAGTSFSSPNAAGTVACLLSALKKHFIPYSPASIKFALSQTAMLPKNENKCEFGNGIIQIDAAFEYCKNDTFQDLKIFPRKKGVCGIIFIKDKCRNVNMKRIVNLLSYINTVIGKKTFKKWILKIPSEAQYIFSVTQIDKNGSFIIFENDKEPKRHA